MKAYSKNTTLVSCFGWVLFMIFTTHSTHLSAAKDFSNIKDKFFNLVKNGKVDELEKLIQNLDLSQRYSLLMINNEPRIEKAIHVAAEGGDFKIFEWLVENISPDKEVQKKYLKEQNGAQLTPLHLAVLAPSSEITSYILSFFDKNEKKEVLGLFDEDGATSLHRAAQRGDTSIIELLLKGYGDQHQDWREYLFLFSSNNDKETALSFADLNNNIEAGKTLLDYAGRSADEKLDYLNYSLEYNEDNKDLWTQHIWDPYFKAVKSSDTQQLQKLINLEKQKNIYVPFFKGDKFDYISLLIFAVQNDVNPAIIEILIENAGEKKLDFLKHENSDQKMALHIALWKNNIENIKVLLKYHVELEKNFSLKPYLDFQWEYNGPEIITKYTKKEIDFLEDFIKNLKKVPVSSPLQLLAEKLVSLKNTLGALMKGLSSLVVG